MSKILLVAQREYRQLTSTRAFWVTLLLIPVILVLSGLLPTLVRAPPGNAFVILDRTGRYEETIRHRVDLSYQKQVLQQLAAYAQRWRASSAGLRGGRGGQSISDDEAETFVAAGGLDAALNKIRPLLPPQATPFEPPARLFLSAPLPAEIARDSSAEAFAAAIGPYLGRKTDTEVGSRTLALAVYLPENMGDPGIAVRLWTNGGGAVGDLVATIRAEATHQLKQRAMQTAGLDQAAAARIESIETPAIVAVARPGENIGRVALRSILPMGFAYLLLLTLTISGAWMLQGMIEERSNKLMETVLACVSPNELMRGKLLGVGAVGLSIILVWIGFATAGAYAIPGDLADTLRPALASLQSPLMALGLIFYFVSGYLVISMLFLAIGSMSDSMQDAQGYLMPVMMLLMLPFIVLVNTMVQNPGGVLPVVMSWIPLYTPFAMLARIGGGVSAAEVLGTGALLVAFIAIELMLLGRVFRASLLRTGQPPKLGELFKLMMTSDAPAARVAAGAE